MVGVAVSVILSFYVARTLDKNSERTIFRNRLSALFEELAAADDFLTKGIFEIPKIVGDEHQGNVHAWMMIEFDRREDSIEAFRKSVFVDYRHLLSDAASSTLKQIEYTLGVMRLPIALRSYRLELTLREGRSIDEIAQAHAEWIVHQVGLLHGHLSTLKRLHRWLPSAPQAADTTALEAQYKDLFTQILPYAVANLEKEDRPSLMDA